MYILLNSLEPMDQTGIQTMHQPSGPGDAYFPVVNGMSLRQRIEKIQY